MLFEGFPIRECVMEYSQDDGSVLREYVSAAKIREFAGDLARIPVTLHHPRDDDGKPEAVTPANFARYGVGDVDGRPELVGNSDAEWEAKGGFVRVGFAVRRDDALAAIANGDVTELSLGYECTAIRQTGIWNGQAYDSVQIGRVHNHLALVDAARVGPDARFRADAAVGRTRVDAGAIPLSTEPTMKPLAIQLLSLLGVLHVDNEEAALREGIDKIRAMAAALLEAKAETDEEKAKREAAEAEALATKDEAKAATDRADKAQGTATALQARIDASDKATRDAADATERTALLPHAERLRVDGPDKLALPALRRAIAKAVLGVERVTDATPDAAISGMVTAIVADARNDADPWVMRDTTDARTDADPAKPKSNARKSLDAAAARFKAATNPSAGPAAGARS